MATSETDSKTYERDKAGQQYSHPEAGKPPKQTTIWIDGDLYEALMIGKARGKGSIKDQVNTAVRRHLRKQTVAEMEAQERRAWAEKPWNEQDEAEFEAFQSIQVTESEWDDS